MFHPLQPNCRSRARLAAISLACQMATLAFPAMAFADTAITISPSSTAIQPGEQFSLDVVMSSDEPTRGIQLGLHYDPQRLSVNRVTPDATFYATWAKSNGAQAKAVIPFTNDPAAQHISTGGIILFGGPPTDGPTGTGTLLHLELTAAPDAQGQTSIDFENLIVSNRWAESVPQVSGTGAIITIGASAAAAPAPTPAVVLPINPPTPTTAGMIQAPKDQPVPAVDTEGISVKPWQDTFVSQFVAVTFQDFPILAGLSALGLVLASVVYRALFRALDARERDARKNRKPEART